MSLVTNKKAGLTYQILDTVSCGIELVGHEVKSLRTNGGVLDGARVIIRGGEMYVVGLYIAPYQAGNVPTSYDATRLRKLLATKKEIIRLLTEMEAKNLTLIPTSLYLSHGLIKCTVALVKRKKKEDKRQDEKKKESRRHTRNAKYGTTDDN